MELWIVIATYIVLILLIIFMMITCVLLLVIKHRKDVYIDAVKEAEYESMSSKGSYENVVGKSIKVQMHGDDLDIPARKYQGITLDAPKPERITSGEASDDGHSRIPQRKSRTLDGKKEDNERGDTTRTKRQGDTLLLPGTFPRVHYYHDKIYLSEEKRDTWPPVFEECRIAEDRSPTQGSNVGKFIAEGTKKHDSVDSTLPLSPLKVSSPTDPPMGPMYETIPEIPQEIQEGKPLTEKPFPETIISYSPREFLARLSQG